MEPWQRQMQMPWADPRGWAVDTSQRCPMEWPRRHSRGTRHQCLWPAEGQRHLHICRLEQQVPQWLIVVRGKHVVLRIHHIEAQRAQVPRLQALTAAVPGLQEVPGGVRQ